MAKAESLEVGPIVAAAMIALGLGVVSWAVMTKERPEVDPTKPRFSVQTGVGQNAPPEAPAGEEASSDGISDEEWEKTLIDVEKLKTDGLVTAVDVSKRIATVDESKWNALEEDRRNEIGRRLAVYAGRVSGADEFTVSVVDQAGEEIASFEHP